jgi:hypothetical protein
MGHIGGANVQKIQVRFMFPQLATFRNHHQGNKVDKDLMHLFFKHAVRPTVLEVLPRENHAEWPIDFGDEQFRARRQNGHVVFTTRSITANHLDAFIQSLHVKCQHSQELKWATGFFLQIQIQGCKQSTRHDVPRPVHLNNPEEAMAVDGVPLNPELDALVEAEFQEQRGGAIVKAINPLDFTLLVPENWKVDVATTVHSQDANYSFLIDTSMHHLLLSVMTGVDAVTAGIHVRRGANAGYSCDETAHLGTASGFRWENKRAREQEEEEAEKDEPKLVVHYAQAYTTEKNLTALKDKGFHAKHVEPSEVFKNYRHMLDNHFVPLEGVFRSALAEDYAVDVRLECRVSLWDALKVHRWIDPETLAACLIKVKTRDFW